MKRIAVAFMVVSLLMAVNVAFAADQPMGGMQPHPMKGMTKSSGMMQEMMTNPHHKLMMVYMKNLKNFAEAIKTEVAATGKVDKDFVTTAMAGMRQSFEQMQKHKQEMMASMPAEKDQQVADRIKMMENRHSVIYQHMDSLEKELNAPNPDAKKVVAESDQIMKQCQMMQMMKKAQKRKQQQM